ncbi:MAG TPA: hypothetical protein VM470_03305 [Acidimicrobiia bacterium]|nr:hypothetical protein [Acidimicrobiia bacterium]
MVTPIIVAGLILAAVWGFWLLPGLFAERRVAPLNSTQEFDRLTRLMADVHDGYDANRASTRDLIRVRRRRTIAIIAVLALVTAVLAWRGNSLNWLLVHLGIDACLGWYLAMLAQLRERQAQKAAKRYFSGGKDWDDTRVKVVGR